MLTSNICPACNIQMTFNGSSPYETSFRMLNKACPNSDVETGSHEHRLYYNDNFYICPNCSGTGIMRVFVKERCAISGFEMSL